MPMRKRSPSKDVEEAQDSSPPAASGEGMVPSESSPMRKRLRSSDEPLASGKKQTPCDSSNENDGRQQAEEKEADACDKEKDSKEDEIQSTLPPGLTELLDEGKGATRLGSTPSSKEGPLRRRPLAWPPSSVAAVEYVLRRQNSDFDSNKPPKIKVVPGNLFSDHRAERKGWGHQDLFSERKTVVRGEPWGFVLRPNGKVIYLAAGNTDFVVGGRRTGPGSIRLPDAHPSSGQIRLQPSSKGRVMMDVKGSTSTVAVNGARVMKSSTALKSGDVFSIKGMTGFHHFAFLSFRDGKALHLDKVGAQLGRRDEKLPSGKEVAQSTVGKSNSDVSDLQHGSSPRVDEAADASKNEFKGKKASAAESMEFEDDQEIDANHGSDQLEESADTQAPTDVPDDASDDEMKMPVDESLPKLIQSLSSNIVRHPDIPCTGFKDLSFDVPGETLALLTHNTFLALGNPATPEALKHDMHRLLLSGPTGTDLMQQELCTSLARELQCNLLVLDPCEWNRGIPPRQASASSAIHSRYGGYGGGVLYMKSGGGGGLFGDENADIDGDDEDDLEDEWGTMEIPTKGASSKVDGTNKDGTGSRLGSKDSNFSKGDLVVFKAPSATSLFTDRPPAGTRGVVKLVLQDNSARLGVAVQGLSKAGFFLPSTNAVPQTSKQPDSQQEQKDGSRDDDKVSKEQDPKPENVPNTQFPKSRIIFVSKSDLQCANSANQPDDLIALNAMFQVAKMPEHQPLLVHIPRCDEFIFRHPDLCKEFNNQVSKLYGKAVIIGGYCGKEGSRSKGMAAFALTRGGNLLDLAMQLEAGPPMARGGAWGSSKPSSGMRKEKSYLPSTLAKSFPSVVSLSAPTEHKDLTAWTKRIERDTQHMNRRFNMKRLKDTMQALAIECDLEGCQKLSKEVLTHDQIDGICRLAVSHELLCHQDDYEKPLKAISPQSVDAAVVMVKASEAETSSISKSLQDVQCENDHEKRLLSEVVPAAEVGVSFEDIGALQQVKSVLQETVMLPLQRPELFRRGNLAKAVKGVLLFGPPGTGKTMLAKAVATEAKANFINVTMSAVTSKWLGEAEKLVKALFTIASKISPCVIFVDEVDSLLGRREKQGEHEAMRKVKNEFMAMWDGLKSQESERILVLGATNRPFDLDDAVLRRFPRRLMVDLPTLDQREQILDVILAKEDLEAGFKTRNIAEATDGFSGSDLKNMCVAAAYQPIRELLKKEAKCKEQSAEDGSAGADQMQNTEPDQDSLSNRMINFIGSNAQMTADDDKKSAELRALRQSDFEEAVSKVQASVNKDSASLQEISRWNEQFGENGKENSTPLTYFM